MREHIGNLPFRKKESGPVPDEQTGKGKRRGNKFLTKSGFAAYIKGLFIVMILTGFMGYQPGSVSAQTDVKTAEIDHFVQSQMDTNNIPGLAVAIVHDNKIMYSKGYGTTGDGGPVTTDTLFPIASLSKSITAFAIMQLVEAGKISLDDLVADLIPAFTMDDPRGSKITVRQLLNQTSGLADTVFPEMAFRKQPNSLEESISRMKNVKLASDPGAKFHYHNPNYQILARVVEVVSKESFSVYLQRHIFTPLHMDHTIEAATTKQFVEADASHFSNGHIFVYGKPVVKKEPDWFVEGAAGNISTVKDMANWLMLQLNGGTYGGVRLLSDEGIKTMHSAPSGINSTYGMGWTVNGSQIGHNGILWTYYADQVLMPDRGYGIVVLFNGGFNALVNYSSFTHGLSEILNGQHPEASFISAKTLEIGIGLLTVLTIIFGIRSFFRLNRWEKKYRKRDKWLSWLYILLTLILPVLFICLPQILTFIGGGRVLKWEQIFILMPSVFIWLMLASMFCIVHVIRKIVIMCRIKRVL